VKYQIGDKVQAARELVDYFPGAGKRVIPADTVGYVSAIFDSGNINTFPYDVNFVGENLVFYANDSDLVPYTEPVPVADTRTRWQRFLDRWFPKRDAERDFGTEETAEAFTQVQQNGTKVTIEGK
jgi:hypothetical protein